MTMWFHETFRTGPRNGTQRKCANPRIGLKKRAQINGEGHTGNKTEEYADNLKIEKENCLINKKYYWTILS